MTEPFPPDLEATLRADDRWLRYLARRLVRDAELAADLAQATWASVFATSPRFVGGRGYLRRALEHVIANFRRGEDRRLRRERGGHEREPEVDASELVARVETQRALSDAVLALPEPYRSTILRRYVEGVAPKEIARRSGIPLDTVKTRLKRGLELLRAALAVRDEGDPERQERVRRGLCVLGGFTPAKAILLQGAAMATKSKAIAAAAIVVVTASWIAIASRDGDPPNDAPTSIVAREPDDAPPAIGDASPQRIARAPTGGIEVPPSPSPVATRRIAVHVTEVDGKPVPDVEIELVHLSARSREVIGRGRSDPTGTARIDVASTEAAGVVVDDSAWIACTSTRVESGERPADVDVVVASKVLVRGIVVDERGEPISGAIVSCRANPTLAQRIARPLAGAQFPMAEGRLTDDEGRFRLSVAGVAGSRVSADKEGFTGGGVALPEAATADVRIVLERSAPAFLRGRVVRADGGAPDAAVVVLGASGARCDDDGAFELALEPDETATTLQAMAAGVLPAKVERPPQGWPDFVELRLGADAARIEGTVVDEHGAPIEGVFVMLGDPTPVRAGTFGTFASVEALSAFDGAELPTSADGRFAMTGLLDRAYDVLALDPRTLQTATAPGIAAGTRDLTIVLPRAGLAAVVRGCVCHDDGSPVRGARVQLAWWNEAVGPRGFVTPHDGVSTDADGSFELTDVPSTGVRLRVDGDGILPVELSIEAARMRDFVVVVDRARRMRVDRARGGSGFVRVLDAAGEPLALYAGAPLHRSRWEVGFVNAGKSEVFVVSARATTLVDLAKDGKRELARIPLTWSDDEVLVVTE